MCLRRHWLGMVASFREDDLFEGETCQKSGGFHHLGKNSSEEGKVARKRQFADHCARFVWVLRVLGVLARSPTKGVSSAQLKQKAARAFCWIVLLLPVGAWGMWKRLLGCQHASAAV